MMRFFFYGTLLDYDVTTVVHDVRVITRSANEGVCADTTIENVVAALGLISG